MQTYDLTTIVLILGGILYLLAAGLVFKRRGFRERAVRWLVLYFVVSCFWELGQALWRLGWLDFLSDDVLTRVPLYGVLLLSLLFLFLSLSFLPPKRSGWGWWVLGVTWIAALVALDANLLALPEVLWARNEWVIQRQGLISAALIVGWVVFMAGTTLLTLRTYHRTEQPLHRNRITYWLLPLSLVVAGDAMLFVGRETLGTVLRLLAALIAAYVLLSHRLPDVRQTARRAASYLTIMLVTVLIYTAGFTAVQYAFQAMPGYNPLLAGAAMALILIVLFNPLLNLVHKLVDRLVSRPSYDPSHTLREYSLSISNILDLERLATVIVGLISEAMEIRRGALLLVYRGKGENEEDIFHLRDVKGMRAEKAGPGVLRANSPVADYLWREHRPLMQYDIDLLPRFQEISPAERAWLSGQGMDVYVPICAKGEWIGLLALGPKVSGDRYFDSDLILLSTLADQTAVALENARLVDDLKRAYDDLDRANRQLQEIDELKSAFIGVVTHELRTPFANIDFSLQLLERYGLEHLLPEQREQMELLTTGIKKAKTMVDNLVTFATFISKQGKLHLSWLDFCAVIQDALPPLESMAEAKGITLHVEVPQEMPLLHGDRNRLADTVYHLVHNAIKFNEEGGEVWVRCSAMTDAVHFDVEDTGVGVPADKLPALWDAFMQMADPLRRGVEGLGLGLALVKYVVYAHGGEVRAQSKEGVGSTFGFWIPWGGPKRLIAPELAE